MKKLLALLLTAMMLLSMLAVSASAEGEPAPIAVYNFENTDNLGKDVSGNKNNLTVKGEVASYADGKYGKGISLDYAGALVASADADGADFVDKLETSGSKQLTLMYWIKYDTSDFSGWDTSIGWRRVVSNGCDGNVGYGGFSMLSLSADNYVIPSAINPAVVFNTEASGTSSTGNWSTYNWTTEWTHIAWTVDMANDHCVFYVDGTAIYDNPACGISAGQALANLARNFAIGANYFVDGEGTEQFNQSYAGTLDDFYVFDKALSAEQIAYYMNNNYEVPAEVEEDVPATGDAMLALIPAALVFGGAILVLGKKKR